jgi:hypothetical protein
MDSFRRVAEADSMPALRTEWPTQAKYVEALQDPPGAFSDPDLQAGIVDANALGLPRPRSGQMASVYKVFDGRKTWAVRCFNFRSDERAERYRAISDFLARSVNRYTVGFAYLPAGIVVDAQPYPIVKMEWVEGDLLDAYIGRHLGAPRVLGRLARSWVEMVRDLHALGMAHGDLQHGNVLVTSAGELKLVDYDGMFVPAFAGWPSLEDGHPNYQHPCRGAKNFGPQLDNFSAWSVYLSIVAVARHRTAWERLGFGADALALRRSDYVCPSASATFAALDAAADADVRRIGHFVRSLLAREPESLPPLETVVAAEAGAPSADRPWPFAPFESVPLGPGIYTEPYEPQTVDESVPDPPVVPESAATPRWLIRAGGGVAATAAGYAVFHGLGFAPAQFAAVAALGWVLAAILAISSRGPTPPPPRP